MSRQKKFLDTDVLTASKERIRHIADTHDTIAVCFSGGKDSLAVLHLVKEVMAERGIDKVNVIFRDEELIPDQVINFVDKYKQLPWVNMLYFAIPLASTKYILGRTYDYIQWDNSREWVRPKPEYAIVMKEGDDRVFDQYTCDEFIGENFKGKVAFLTGIRASESLMRFRASVNKLHENYITRTETDKVSLCKPLYDWQENDIFKYFYDNKINYCEYYDYQMMAGGQLRVSTPLHSEMAKRIGMLREVDPAFYDRVLKLFPEMQAQDRYYKDLDTKALTAKYGKDLATLKTYIDENYTDPMQYQKANARYKEVCGLHTRYPESFPTNYIFKYFMTGAFKRGLLPLGKKKTK